MPVDVIVIGAGAAGFLAATRAAERGLKTLLLEKNKKPGVKILMSGGTRCNLTHNTDSRGIVKAYGDQGPFLHSALAALPPADVVALFEAEGVETKVEETGKIFPVSDRATDVLGALLQRQRRSGAELSLAEPVLRMERLPTGEFEVTTGQRILQAAKVVLTTGGKSYPGCGTTGDGYGWAAAFGHTIVPPRPALVPILTTAPWIATLKGITIPDTKVAVVEKASTSTKKKFVLAEARGSFLFTHWGLSGPTVLDVSRAVTGHPRPRDLSLVCDFLPRLSVEALTEELRSAGAAAGKKLVANLVPEILPARLAEALVEVAGIPLTRRAAELSKNERVALVAALKECVIPVNGTLGFEKAEVTAGGVSLAEVHSQTMESKLAAGLFLAGEILDLDGPIGGFNFQAAFSTGWLAGESV